MGNGVQLEGRNGQMGAGELEIFPHHLFTLFLNTQIYQPFKLY